MKKRRPISRPPLIIFVGAIFGVIYIFLPLVGLLRKISFVSLLSQLSDGPTLSALRLSLVTSVAATLLALILGLPLAWVLARV